MKITGSLFESALKLLVYLTLPLTLFFLNLSYADAAEEDSCQRVGAHAVHDLPPFMKNPTTGCDALPQEFPKNINKLCQSLVPQSSGFLANCAATYYPSNMSATTVLQCSAVPVQGAGTVIFKYTLCANHKNSDYMWVRIIPSVEDAAHRISAVIWQKTQ